MLRQMIPSAFAISRAMERLLVLSDGGLKSRAVVRSHHADNILLTHDVAQLKKSTAPAPNRKGCSNCPSITCATPSATQPLPARAVRSAHSVESTNTCSPSAWRRYISGGTDASLAVQAAAVPFLLLRFRQPLAPSAQRTSRSPAKHDCPLSFLTSPTHYTLALGQQSPSSSAT